MRYRIALALVAFVSAAVVCGQAQQTQNQQTSKAPGMGMPAEEPLDIWQIDLNPSGTGFALTTPVDKGDVWVFKVWPDRAIVRLPKARVKKMVRRTKDVSNEVLYQINMVPKGQMYSRDVPVQKGGTYEFHNYTGGTLMSVRQTDVQEIVKVSGLDAFKIHLQQYGAKANANLPMQGGGNVTVLTEAPNPPSPSQSQEGYDPGSGQGGSYWIYQGVPGVTDAWAPPQAVIDKPGDPPRARPN
jgi:hypothetical protein